MYNSYIFLFSDTLASIEITKIKTFDASRIHGLSFHPACVVLVALSSLKTEIISPEVISLSVDFNINSEIINQDPQLAEELLKNNLDLDELKVTVKMIGQFINSIENKVYKQFPEIKYIDLEIN